MEREAVLVGIDVGTSKVCALIGEVEPRRPADDHGPRHRPAPRGSRRASSSTSTRPSARSRTRSSAPSGCPAGRSTAPSSASAASTSRASTRTGQVAVTAHHREVTREDINRAIEVARAVSIPSNREVLHVERRGFTVDGQEGVKDPLGMSALRLEVETHIVTASATAVQNLTKCVAAAGRQDRRARRRLAGLGRGRPDRDREGARRRGRRHRRRARSTSPCSRTARRSTRAVLPVGGNNVTNDVAIGLKTSLQVAEELKIQPRDVRPARRSARTRRSASRSSARTPAGRSAGSRSARSSRPGCARRSSCCATRCRAAGVGMLPAGIILTGGGGAARGRRRARPRGPPDAGPGRRARRASAASSTRS